jgi:L-ascorbate metabolism protein UlaG (beta-lactamase superfamily)
MRIEKKSVFAIASILLLSMIPINVNAEQNTVNLTWFGFTSFEIATPDYSSVVYTNPNIWRYNQSQAFEVKLKPPYESPESLANFLKEKNAKDIVLTLTNDHPDEIGDLFELEKAFQDANLPYKIVAQSDLARNWMIPEMEKRGINTDVVMRIGYGGKVSIGDVRIIGTLALHGSSPWPLSMVIDVNGVRVWHTGGTAIFSDMRLIDKLYNPQIALISITDAQFSMGPMEAGYAARLLRPEIAIPTHYLASAEQFPNVSTLEDVEEFKKYVDEFTFGKVKVVMPKLGEPFTYTAGAKVQEASDPAIQTYENNDTVYLATLGAGTFFAGLALGKRLKDK